MFRLTRPTDLEIQQFLDDCKASGFSYDGVGSSRMGSPAGYNVDHHRVLLGNGFADFERAKKAVDQWKMFNFEWIRLYHPDTPIIPGNNVAVVARHLGLYSINGSRIVYIIDEHSPEITTYGFAYGTLTCHVESGEERFSVELHSKTGEVWYDLYAFSKPDHPLARSGYPYGRYLQKEFAKASMGAMKRAVNARPSN